MLRKIYFCQSSQAIKLSNNNSYSSQIIIVLNSITKYFVTVKLSCQYQILKKIFFKQAQNM